MNIFHKIVKSLLLSGKHNRNRKNKIDKDREDFDTAPSDNFPYVLILRKTKISVN